MSLIVSGSNCIKIWNFDSTTLNQCASATAGVEDILTARWNHTNQVVAAGTSDSNIHLLQGQTGQVLSTLSFQQSRIVGAVRSVSFSSNSRYLAGAVKNCVHIWDLKRRSIKVSLGQHRADIDAVAFTTDGALISGDDNGELKIWDVNRGECTSDLKRSGRSAAVRCVDVSAFGQIASGYGDGGFTMWDIMSGLGLCQYPSLHRGSLHSVAVSPKNPRLVTSAGEDGRINLIDTAAPISSGASAFIDSGERIMSISFQENAIHSAVGTHSGNIIVYDWRNMASPLIRLPAHSPFPVFVVSFQVYSAIVFFHVQDFFLVVSFLTICLLSISNQNKNKQGK